jgi:hypothetical protein
VAKYSELWSLYVNRVHPHVPSLTTASRSPHNRVQNKHVKILHRCRALYLCTVQRVLTTHWDSRRLDWTRLGRCEHPVTLESDWTGLDSTRLCWCVRTLWLITTLTCMTAYLAHSHNLLNLYQQCNQFVSAFLH